MILPWTSSSNSWAASTNRSRSSAPPSTAGKIVVTGNKALLAEHGQEIFALAAERKVPVFFEASTAGGIPIIKTIREALIANHIVSIHGIINGTSNYILTRMTDAGLDFAAALAEAQSAGLRRSRPDARHQRLGRRAQGNHPRVAGLRVLGRHGQDFRRGHR